jgi:ubiquinone/menaquinone biosynthesis C-methylase UbiE
MQTIELAKLSNAEITAVDNHQPFLDALEKQALNEGVSSKIRLVKRDMNNLGFEAKSFNVIWSEGAIYNIGFKKGLHEWRKFLVDNGYLAVSELCWLDPNPPQEVKEFFKTGYPAMKTVKENLEMIAKEGYRIVGYFVLPESSWWTDYYLPIASKLPALKEKYRNDNDALAAISREELEMEMLRKYSKHYGYVFFVMQAQ